MWLWHKLAHLEEFGDLRFEPSKRHLAVMWGMPELISGGGFRGWKERVPRNRVRVLGVDDIDVMANVAKLNLNDNEGG